jgi:sugar PTS system EIIA component
VTAAAGLVVVAPVTGRVLPMADVPDPVFAASLVGPGLAIEPPDSEGTAVAVAPVSGTVVKLHPHAYVIQTAEGAGVLTHLGIDTVQLKGEGFDLKVAEGDTVAAGDPMVSWDPAAVVAGGRSAMVPVVALEGGPDAVSAAQEGDTVDAGAPLFTWRR